MGVAAGEGASALLEELGRRRRPQPETWWRWHRLTQELSEEVASWGAAGVEVMLGEQMVGSHVRLGREISTGAPFQRAAKRQMPSDPRLNTDREPVVPPSWRRWRVVRSGDARAERSGRGGGGGHDYESGGVSQGEWSPPTRQVC